MLIRLLFLILHLSNHKTLNLLQNPCQIPVKVKSRCFRRMAQLNYKHQL